MAHLDFKEVRNEPDQVNMRSYSLVRPPLATGEERCLHLCQFHSCASSELSL